MEDTEQINSYSRARLDDRQVTELIGLARGLIADDFLSDDEVRFLYKWLVANEHVVDNPIISLMEKRLAAVLEDNIIDEEERTELFVLLQRLVSNDFELGELIRSSQLPLCSPPPHIIFQDMSFCFTGTFSFGNRRECEREVIDRGGSAGSLKQKTNFLVIGEYATESWIQSTYGRKIEKAVDLREKGFPIRIVSEAHWRTSLW